MGYESLIANEPTLSSRYRNEFPVTENLIYLNHAAVGPLSRRSAEAMKSLADDALMHGSWNYNKWLDAYEGLRVAAARLINGDRNEIGIVKNTSEGIAAIAMGLDWRAGDRVVVFEEEFPANYLPWQRLESWGVQIERLSVLDSLDRIEQAARGARLLAISFVQYLGGYRADLNAIGDICHRNGVIFFVDAIQGLGVFPLDVREARIHALAADGHKWLMGPEGCGILFIRQDFQDSVEPVEFGWTNVASYNDYSSHDLSLRTDAGRYECGTLNTIGCFGLRAAIELTLEIGVDKIAPAVQRLGDRVAEGVQRKGYELCSPRSPENGSGIVSFRRSDIDSRMIIRRLKDRSILAAPRQGWVRVSPHFYISDGDIDRMLESLP